MEKPGHAALYIEKALAEARSRNPQINSKCFAFVHDVLLRSESEAILPAQRESRLAFVMRWQQLTGAIVAKGLEDTLLYVYFPLLSLNDVGGDPRPAPVSVREFGDFIRDRCQHSPHGLNSTATHDTKRGEDVRARINVLSELPGEWHKRLSRWFRWNRGKARVIDGQTAPDCNEEIFVYQTLVGAWPLDERKLHEFRNRMREYVLKSSREAKVHTRWTRPNPSNEKAVLKFVAAITKPSKSNLFLADFEKFQRKTAYFGMLNGLGQTLIKITAPGVPEIYQGCELWDLRLVDPDNRHAVDYAIRKKFLAEVEKRSCGHEGARQLRDELVSGWRDGRIKLYAIWKVLNFRRKHPQLFLEGDFTQLKVTGRRATNVFAYARRHGNDWLVAIVPRWLAHAKAPMNQREMPMFWSNTKILLPDEFPKRWTNLLSGDALLANDTGNRTGLRVAQLIGDFPVACLASGTQMKEA
jgi:(1->4)-alpha-D-glucan 1-alpha-D-glucosylmutase